MIILYINDEHCSCVEQLKEFFNNGVEYGSPLFMDLVDYGRAGELAQWLMEQGETELAKAVDSINENIGDGEYISLLSSIFRGEKSSISESQKGIIMPNYLDFFEIRNVDIERDKDITSIIVTLKIKKVINETFELGIRTIWGTRAVNINSYDKNVGETFNLVFNYRNRQNSIINDAVIMLNKNELKQIIFDEIIQTLDGSEKYDINESDEYMEIFIGDNCFKMVFVEHGTFIMGEDVDPNTKEIDYTQSMPAHRVEICKDFYIGECLVTQKLWETVMENNPSKYIGKNKPVEQVSWYDCRLFISKLNKKFISKLKGKMFRFPSEAEWEFAARGGNLSCHTVYSGSNQCENVAWFGGKSTFDIKRKQANELGIYDMSGNVGEWCSDAFEFYNGNPHRNNRRYYDNFDSMKIFRGGGRASSEEISENSCSVFYRNGTLPTKKHWYIGLRLCLS